MMSEVFDPKILDLYERTVYSIRDERGEEVFFTVREAARHPKLQGRNFAILTAWNPMNQPLSSEENTRRNQALENELRKTACIFYPSRGVLGDHFEESFTVEDLPESEAARLGSLFEQYAVVVSNERGCRLIRCPVRGL